MNYYSLLGIDANANSETIKKAFRKKLKEHHPDVHHSKQKKDASQPYHHESLLDIINAYNILSNPIRRNQYDNNKPYQYEDKDEDIFEPKQRKSFNYEAFLLQRNHIWEYKIKLFLYDLVYRKGVRAARIYTIIVTQDKKDALRDTLGYHDYFDCMFLLAEYYHEKGKKNLSIKLVKKLAKEPQDQRSFLYINKALKLFLEIGIMETERAYFKSYMEEVATRVFDILSHYDNEPSLNMHLVHQLLHSMQHWNITKQQKTHIECFVEQWRNI